LLIVGLAVSFVVSKNGIGYAYLAFASSESRCCSFFLGQRPRARHRFSYSQPRGVVCRLGKRPCVRLSAFVFVGLAVLHVSSGSGIVCAISFLIASLAVSSVFSDGGLVCAYQLSESIPYGFLGRWPRVRLSAFIKYPIRTRSGRRFFTTSATTLEQILPR
jgi:hypothetical protein